MIAIANLSRLIGTIGLLALPCAYHAARLLPVAGAFGLLLE